MLQCWPNANQVTIGISPPVFCVLAEKLAILCDRALAVQEVAAYNKTICNEKNLTISKDLKVVPRLTTDRWETERVDCFDDLQQVFKQALDKVKATQNMIVMTAAGDLCGDT